MCIRFNMHLVTIEAKATKKIQTLIYTANQERRQNDCSKKEGQDLRQEHRQQKQRRQ